MRLDLRVGVNGHSAPSVEPAEIANMVVSLSSPLASATTGGARRVHGGYSVIDAVVVGGLLISLLRHSDRVTIACQAQLANAIAPIRTEPGGPAWRQTIFHPFALTSRLARGTVLRVALDAPAYETARFGEVPVVDAVATHDPATGALTVFVVNRDQTSPVALSVPLSAFAAGLTVRESWTLSDPDLHATNSATDPDRVVPHPATDVALRDGTLTATLPPVSWTVIHLS